VNVPNVEPGPLRQDGMAHDLLRLELFVAAEVAEARHRSSSFTPILGMGRAV
jgi:hypothetical protein